MGHDGVAMRLDAKHLRREADAHKERLDGPLWTGNGSSSVLEALSSATVDDAGASPRVPSTLKYSPTPNLAGLYAQAEEAANASLGRIVETLSTNSARFARWAAENDDVLRWLSARQARHLPERDRAEGEAGADDARALVDLFETALRAESPNDAARISGWVSKSKSHLDLVAQYLVLRKPRSWQPARRASGEFAVALGLQPAWLERLDAPERLRLGLVTVRVAFHLVRGLAAARDLVLEFLQSEQPEPENLVPEFGRVLRRERPFAIVRPDLSAWSTDSTWQALAPLAVP